MSDPGDAKMVKKLSKQRRYINGGIVSIYRKEEGTVLGICKALCCHNILRIVIVHVWHFFRLRSCDWPIHHG